MKDRELIRQIQGGNRELMNELIEKYYDEVLHFCIYQLRNHADAYDLTQETFCRFIRQIEVYRYRNLKAYLIAIARNLCVDYWKSRKNNSSLEEMELMESVKAPGKQTLLEQTEDRMVLTELLAKIPAEQREVLILRYYNDLKLADISRILDVNLSTVKSRLRLGVRAMRIIEEKREEEEDGDRCKTK